MGWGGGGVIAKIQNLAFLQHFWSPPFKRINFLKNCFVILGAGIKKYSAP